MDSRHWEDSHVEKEDERIPDVTPDIELSMNKLFLNDLEEGEDHSVKMEKIVVPPLHPLVLHAITLHKHANTITDLMKLNEGNKSEKLDLKPPQFESKHPISPLNLTPKDFRASEDINITELSRTVVQKILTKCVATLFAQVGYENSQQSALDVLTDLLEEFLKKICLHVKIAISDKENMQYSGFPHVIERVLTEMGIGGVRALSDYYQTRVINYVNVLENRCRDLTEEYQTQSVPKSPSPIDKFNKVVRVKVEEEDVIEVENPEVHFSTIDGDVSLSILETGYQLLNSLEAEANLHNMGDGVEDIAVTESPGIVSLSSDDTSHLSPYNKKKRFK